MPWFSWGWRGQGKEAPLLQADSALWDSEKSDVLLLGLVCPAHFGFWDWGLQGAGRGSASCPRNGMAAAYFSLKATQKQLVSLVIHYGD